VDVHIGQVSSEVRPVDDRSVLSPVVLSKVVDEVMRAIEARQSGAERRENDTQLWGSVRSGTGR
jgi:hypothetical protein